MILRKIIGSFIKPVYTKLKEYFYKMNFYRRMEQRKASWDNMQDNGYFKNHGLYPDWPQNSENPRPVNVKNALSQLNYNYHYQRITKLISFTPDMTVLDIGCGFGRFEEWLSPLVRDVYGIDIASSVIEVCKKRFIKIQNVHFYDGDGYTLQMFQNNTFDVILSYTVFQHIPRDAALHYLIECKRTLKTQGVCVIQYLGTQDDFEIDKYDVGIDEKEYRVRYTKKAILEQAQSAGLKMTNYIKEPKENNAVWFWVAFTKTD